MVVERHADFHERNRESVPGSLGERNNSHVGGLLLQRLQLLDQEYPVAQLQSEPRLVFTSPRISQRAIATSTARPTRLHKATGPSNSWARTIWLKTTFSSTSRPP